VRALVIAIIAVPSAASHAANGVAPTKRPQLGCEVLDHGVYVPVSQRTRYSDGSSVTGERFEIDEVRFVRRTKLIEPTLGQRFGIRYRLTGIASPSVRITWRVVYPSPVRASNGWQHSFRVSAANGELVGHLLYDFVLASELVEGRWQFDVLVDGHPACSFGFLVQQPRMAGIPALRESAT